MFILPLCFFFILLPGAAAAETGSSAADQPAAVTGGSNGFLGSLWQSLTNEAYLRAGYGVVKWTMDVKRSSDGARATLVQRDPNALFLGYGSKSSFFDGSNFGYTFMVNYVDFNMQKQEVPGDRFADYGTEVNGFMVYAVPTLFYQWGEHREKGKFVRLGLGVGVGGARYHGTVRMSTGETVYTEQRSLEPRLAASNFLEARWKYVDLSVSYAAPRVYGDGYDVRVSDFSASIGCFYYF